MKKNNSSLKFIQNLQFMKRILFMFLFFTILFSCEKSENSKQIESENQNLVIQKQDLENQVKKLDEQLNTIQQEKLQLEIEEQQKTTDQNPITYYFIVLEITEKVFTTTGTKLGKNLYYTSEIGETTNYNDNTKYKLLDNMVKIYNRDVVTKHKTILNNREIFTFDTYQEASETREQYIMKND